MSEARGFWHQKGGQSAPVFTCRWIDGALCYVSGAPVSPGPLDAIAQSEGVPVYARTPDGSVLLRSERPFSTPVRDAGTHSPRGDDSREARRERGAGSRRFRGQR